LLLGVPNGAADHPFSPVNAAHAIAAWAGPRTVRPVTTNQQVTDLIGTDPRSIFLTPAEYMTRRKWGRTNGYARMAESDFPPLLDGATASTRS
jgi:hypothetical protein